MNRPRKPPRRRVDGVLLLDKPVGPSSNAALQEAKRLLNAAKAGHTGTLDPLASGLLPLCFGEATKFSGELLAADKHYRATLRLGARTDSGDAEGRVIATRTGPPPGRDEIEAVLARFRGEISQVPPMHSALKRDGRPLYEYARQGLDVERQPRRVTISSLELSSLAGDRLELEIDCSKGTYVRTLADDIGEALGCGAHLTALRRTRIGAFGIDGAVTLATLADLPAAARDGLLLPVEALLGELPALRLDAAAAWRFGHGQAVAAADAAGGKCRVHAADGRFLGLGRCADGWLAPVRLLALDIEKTEDFSGGTGCGQV
ncbi:MAG TPA: tRNA pseudouridine(55) synthase TruB [Candidatus Desulfobacillus sp.]|nr:tRNA pseudouridine(55) synthase TruB [Candidatus Desulfobacillus sp.]